MSMARNRSKAFTVALLASAISSVSYAEFTLEEVQVTARKRAESVQDVPDSVTVLGAGQIESAGIRDLKGVAALTPNLSMDDNYRPGTARISVRGMITPQVGDPPIAYVVDGVTAPSMDFINQDLHAVERIEVIRGPQGALYGKGAVGGAINIVTRQPTNEMEGELKLEVGNGNTQSASGYWSGALVDDELFYRVGANYSDRDGFIENALTGDTVDFSELASFSGLLSYALSDEAQLDLRARYSEQDAGVGYYSVVERAEDIGRNLWRPQEANIPGISNRDLVEVSAKYQLDTEVGELLLVAGYSEVDDQSFSDSDYTASPSDYEVLFAGAQETLYGVKAYTSELRFTAQAGQSVEWQVGAYYQLREVDSTLHLWDDFLGDAPRGRDSFDVPADEFSGENWDPDFLTEYFYSIVDRNTSDAWALFGQADVALTEALNLSMALRYDMDQRESFDWRDVSGTRAQRDFSELQPKVQLSYDVRDNLMAYVSLSRGFRSGGFNEPHPDIARVFEQEVSDNLEVGIKSSLLDQTLMLNGALFNVDTEDTQYTRFNVDTFTLENLGIDASRAQGAELEFQFLASESLRFHGGYGYVQSTVEQYDMDPSLEGARVPGVYRSNLNVGGEYFVPVDRIGELQFRLDYLRNGPVAWDLQNTLHTGATAFFNARASLVAERSRISVFAENLTNEAAPSDAFALDYGYGRQPGRPRYFGVEFGYSF